LTVAQLSPRPDGYGRGFASGPYYAALLDHVEKVPEIAAAALSYNAPMGDVPTTTVVGIVGSASEVRAEHQFVTNSYFNVLVIPLAIGETFSRHDRPQGPRTVVPE
jgi:hypothetical protein